MSNSLRPFFGFYGGKWRDTPNCYPPPHHPKIIEPFAGSAGYSVRYPERRVVLVDLDPIIVGVWQFLIKASERDVVDLPDIPMGGTVDDLPISQEARWLIGFWLNRGVASPRKTPSKWMRSGIRPGSHWGARVRHTIASQLHAIRHWKVVYGSYEDAFDEEATWFIDPPYQNAGKHYRHGSGQINYDHLGIWCQSRRGQVIVCENVGATWLPFEPNRTAKTTRRGRASMEALWLNHPAALNSLI